MAKTLTPEVGSALAVAQWVAEASGRVEIGPEHLLTGVLAVAPECLGKASNAEVLRQLGHSELLARRPEKPSPYMPFSEGARTCLAAASARAEHLGDRWIRSEHILASLLGDARTDTAKALLSAGVTAEALDASAASRPPGETEQVPAGPTMHAFVMPPKGHRGTAV